MSILAAAVTGGGLVSPVIWKDIRNYPSCFASIGTSVFQAIVNNNGNPDDCLGHALILGSNDKRDEWGVEACRTFLLSDAVKILTNHGIISAEMPNDNWFGKSIGETLGTWSDYNRSCLLHVVFKMDTHADSLITALRISQSHWKLSDRRSYGNLRDKSLEILPLVTAMKHSDGIAFSDSYVTFYPVTAGKIREYMREEDEDNLDDIYFSRAAEYALENGEGLSTVTQEMVIRLLKGERRPDRPLNTKAYDGYTKDEAMDQEEFDSLPDDACMSITSPWCLCGLPGETPMGNKTIPQNIRDIIAKLEGN